jgi:hypothetical protein
MIPADREGLAQLAFELGSEVKACVETMSGAIRVKDRPELCGWSVEVANACKVRDISPLACKTDKVDARVLAELCRRELVPAVWVASAGDRAIRERLRRRVHLVKLRLGQGPDLRPLDPVRAADLLHAPSPTGCARAARAARGSRGLARLDRHSPPSRSTSSTGGSARSIASWRQSQGRTQGPGASPVGLEWLHPLLQSKRSRALGAARQRRDAGRTNRPVGRPPRKGPTTWRCSRGTSRSCASTANTTTGPRR